MNDQYARMMTKFPLLDGFTEAGAKMLMELGEIKEYGSGELLFSEGAPATFVLLLLSGRLEVLVERQGREVVIREEQPGTIVGELAVLCRSTRSAAVRAAEKSVVLQWSGSAFRVMLLRHELLSERILMNSLSVLVERERSLVATLLEEQGIHR